MTWVDTMIRTMIFKICEIKDVCVCVCVCVSVKKVRMCGKSLNLLTTMYLIFLPRCLS